MLQPRDEVMKTNGVHNHVADARQMEKSNCFTNIRENATQTQDGSHHVIYYKLHLFRLVKRAALKEQ